MQAHSSVKKATMIAGITNLRILKTEKESAWALQAPTLQVTSYAPHLLPLPLPLPLLPPDPALFKAALPLVMCHHSALPCP